jgi:hypothetical protein
MKLKGRVLSYIPPSKAIMEMTFIPESSEDIKNMVIEEGDEFVLDNVELSVKEES